MGLGIGSGLELGLGKRLGAEGRVRGAAELTE